jgi:hypothetical protein
MVPSLTSTGTRRARPWLELLWVILAGMVPTVVAIRSLGLGWREWSEPWIGGDMLTTYALAKNLSNGNWFLFNPDVGYPGFQDLGHYPVPDLLNVAAVGALSWLLPSPVAAVNVFAIGTFFGVGAVTYVAFRRLGVDAYLALLASWVFALLPWHFIRVHGHVFLANYVSIPLALLLVDAVARGTLEQMRRRRYLFWYATAALVVGISGIYYALMATALIATVLVVRCARRGIRSVGLRTAAVAALVPASALAAIMVNKLSVATPQVGESVVRDPIESVANGGGVVSLLIPDPTSWTGAQLARHLDLGFPISFEGAAMFSSGAAAATLVTLLMLGFRWTSRRAVDPASVAGRVGYWPGLFLLVLGLFTAYGFGAWGRFSIYLAGISLLIVALALTAWRASPSTWRRWAAMLAAIFFAGLSLADALWAPARPLPPRAAFSGLAAEVSSIVDAMETRLPGRCPILNLPIVPFPESGPVGNLVEYDEMWSYLFSTDLRWSYGGVRGTETGDWGEDMKSDPVALRDAAMTAGFCGVLLDTTGLVSPDELTSIYESLGDPEIASKSGRWVYFDLTSARPGEYTYRPLSGFDAAEASPEVPLFWWMTSAKGAIEVVGAANRRQDVELTFAPTACGAAQVSVDGRTQTIDGPASVTVSAEFGGTGRATVDVRALSKGCLVEGDPRETYVQLVGQSPRQTAAVRQ